MIKGTLILAQAYPTAISSSHIFFCMIGVRLFSKSLKAPESPGRQWAQSCKFDLVSFC